jgi:hypothetical protein
VAVEVGQIVEAVQGLLDATRGARAALDATEDVLVHGLEVLDTGAELVDVIHSLPVRAQRQSTQDAVEQVNLARHRLRVLLFAACVDAGMTPRDIAEEWGVSRQRVDQFVQEFRKTSGD